MFKKIISVICFIFALFIGCQINIGNIAYAQDVYVGEYGQSHFYMRDETLRIKNYNKPFIFTVRVKEVYEDGSYEERFYGFYNGYGKNGPYDSWRLSDRENATHYQGRVNGATRVILNGCLPYV